MVGELDRRGRFPSSARVSLELRPPGLEGGEGNKGEIEGGLEGFDPVRA